MVRRKKRLSARLRGTLGSVILSAVVLATAGLYWKVRELSADVNALRDQLERPVATGQFKKSAASKSEQDNNVAERVSHNGNTYDTYTVDLSRSRVKLYFRDSTGSRFGSLDNLKQYLESASSEMVFGTNAGMFTGKGEPLGLFVEEGTEMFPINLQDGSDNFYLKPNGVFILTDKRALIVESSRFKEVASPLAVQYATQSGPLLVVDGNLHPRFRKQSDNINIRSGVGIIGPDKVVFAISNEPVTFYNFATLFKEKFGCKDALYLDGAISKMYLPALKRNELGGDFGAMIAITRETGRFN